MTYNYREHRTKSGIFFCNLESLDTVQATASDGPIKRTLTGRHSSSVVVSDDYPAQFVLAVSGQNKPIITSRCSILHNRFDQALPATFETLTWIEQSHEMLHQYLRGVIGR